MTSTFVFLNALDFARKAHSGQFDKCGEPYFLHPLQVAMRCSSWDERTVGLLHDVVEDCGVTLDDLRVLGCSEEQVRAVDALSRRTGETYSAFIERIVAAGPLAIRVKLADLEENMRPDRRHPEQEGLSSRYVKSRLTLEDALRRAQP